MLCGGIDVGAQSVKAVIFDRQAVLGTRTEITEEDAEQAAMRILSALLRDLGLNLSQVDRVFATGWGARELSFVDGRSSEQVCAARGARWLFPGARTVLDMGAEGCRAMKLGPDGALEDFANNAKCASGTGAFIELGAVYLKVPIEQMGPLSLAAKGVAEVSSTCAVFAESVVISNIHRGESGERIAAGIHRAAATRAAELLKRIGIVEDVVMVGGAALNTGLVKALEEMAGVRFLIPDDPRTVVALGGAIRAGEKRGGRAGNETPRGG